MAVWLEQWGLRQGRVLVTDGYIGKYHMREVEPLDLHMLQ